MTTGYGWELPQRCSSLSMERRGLRRSGKQRAEAERMIVALMGMLAAFEEIVHQTLGSRYSAEDRRKIAAGMAAVVVTEGIPLDRLAADKVLFGKVLIASIQFLTQQHQIS